jgi:hypothetical protein
MQKAKRFFNRLASSQAIKEVNKKSDEVFSLTMMIFVLWFMYIAMLPIM